MKPYKRRSIESNVECQMILLEQRFGVLDISQNYFISSFKEKNAGDTGRINAGYMVIPEIFE